MAEDPPKFKIAREGQHFMCPDGQDLLELAEAEEFSVSGVAEALNLTNRQLEYAVERASGLRPKELFRRHRMLLARRLAAVDVSKLRLCLEKKHLELEEAVQLATGYVEAEVPHVRASCNSASSREKFA